MAIPNDSVTANEIAEKRRQEAEEERKAARRRAYTAEISRRSNRGAECTRHLCAFNIPIPVDRARPWRSCHR